MVCRYGHGTPFMGFVGLAFLCLSMNPAYGFTLSVSNDGTGLSESLELDASTSFTGNAVLGEGQILHESAASGSGNNSLQESLTGTDSSISNIIESHGTLTTSSTDSVSAESCTASRKTEISGDAGYIASSAISEENEMNLAGGFEGEGGYLTANLVTSSGEQAGIGGDASILGVDCVDETVLNSVSSGDIAMTVEGLYDASKSMGSFGIMAMNSKKRTPKSSEDFLIPDYTPDGGDQNSYKLAGWRWNTQNPQIKMFLRDDANLRNENLDPTAVDGSVTAATQTWESATSQNLFADTDPVEISTQKAADRYDGSNVIAFKPFSGNAQIALAYTRTYYSYIKVNGYYSAKESDISFNTLYNWQTSDEGSNYDIQSVALHELGHTLGLADIYNDPNLFSDTRQVMNSYTGVKRTLGNGDKTGAWILYG
ncbi:MAG: Matrixin [Methanosaeta sp. PtaU1.Bin060]|jgi:hypothetical protein|nr:MAG: Matrixin [Methanosaeta sp. PtaU1.Bin060]